MWIYEGKRVLVDNDARELEKKRKREERESKLVVSKKNKKVVVVTKKKLGISKSKIKKTSKNIKSKVLSEKEDKERNQIVI